MGRRPYRETIARDYHLASGCRMAYEVSEDFGLFELDTVTGEQGVTLVFVGSDDVVDWTYNVRLGMAWAARFGGSMHGGFAHLWNSSAPSLMMHMRRAWPDPAVPLTIAGHSLGGALATIAAVEMRGTFPEATIDLVTFGAPRIFDGRAVASLGRRLAARHYVLGTDPIPHLPSWRPWRRYATLPGRVWLRRPSGSLGGDGWPSFWHRIPVIKDHAVQRYEAALADLAGTARVQSMTMPGPPLLLDDL